MAGTLCSCRTPSVTKGVSLHSSALPWFDAGELTIKLVQRIVVDIVKELLHLFPLADVVHLQECYAFSSDVK